MKRGARCGWVWRDVKCTKERRERMQNERKHTYGGTNSPTKESSKSSARSAGRESKYAWSRGLPQKKVVTEGGIEAAIFPVLFS